MDTDKLDVVLRFEKSGRNSGQMILDDNEITVLDRKDGASYQLSKRNIINAKLHPQLEGGSSEISILAYPKASQRRKKVVISAGKSHSEVEALLREVDKHVFPRRKKLLILVNPFSGTKSAIARWKFLQNLLDIREQEYEMIETKSRGHASQIVTSLDRSLYGGVVTVSGDGLIHEVINGAWNREDRDKFLADVPLGILPGGSGNGVSCSLLFQNNEHFGDELTAASMNIAIGETHHADLIHVQTDQSEMVSILGIGWGLVSACDLDSEVIRWVGHIRSHIWGAFRIIVPKYYHGKVHYLPSTEQQDENEVEMPDPSQPVPETWETVSGPFVTVFAAKQTWLDYSTLVAPKSRYNDGYIFLLIAKAIGGRASLIRWFWNISNPDYIQSPESGILIIKTKAFRFEPDVNHDTMTVDGEPLHCKLVQGKVVTNKLKIMLNENTSEDDPCLASM